MVGGGRGTDKNRLWNRAWEGWPQNKVLGEGTVGTCEWLH